MVYASINMQKGITSLFIVIVYQLCLCPPPCTSHVRHVAPPMAVLVGTRRGDRHVHICSMAIGEVMSKLYMQSYTKYLPK